MWTSEARGTALPFAGPLSLGLVVLTSCSPQPKAAAESSQVMLVGPFHPATVLVRVFDVVSQVRLSGTFPQVSDAAVFSQVRILLQLSQVRILLDLSQVSGVGVFSQVRILLDLSQVRFLVGARGLVAQQREAGLSQLKASPSWVTAEDQPLFLAKVFAVPVLHRLPAVAGDSLLLHLLPHAVPANLIGTPADESQDGGILLRCVPHAPAIPRRFFALSRPLRRVLALEPVVLHLQLLVSLSALAHVLRGNVPVRHAGGELRQVLRVHQQDGAGLLRSADHAPAGLYDWLELGFGGPRPQVETHGLPRLAQEEDPGQGRRSTVSRRHRRKALC
ncbi:hypothetical protein JZ751_029852 [Albula glossodonta]|uniref:STAS domain-containing protein n=1 Tax=Albula glossodonta TaxID=121402 RepID=A0A8T2NAW6_9TELE|nr:hypothetical protein JZ751_029852 [Albula glossodonta]